MSLPHFLAAFLIFASFAATPAVAQKKESKPATAKPDAASAQQAKEIRRKALAAKAKKRNEYLMDFVRTNHPELEQLLLSLKESRPRNYRVAMQSLNKEVRRIDSLKKNNQRQYKLAIKSWSIQSHLNVAKAQYRLKSTPENLQSIRKLVARQLNFQIEKMKSDAEALRKRADVLENKSKEFTEKRNSIIEGRLKNVARKKK